VSCILCKKYIQRENTNCIYQQKQQDISKDVAVIIHIQSGPRPARERHQPRELLVHSWRYGVFLWAMAWSGSVGLSLKKSLDVVGDLSTASPQSTHSSLKHVNDTLQASDWSAQFSVDMISIEDSAAQRARRGAQDPFYTVIQ
jgi:hypothetical protein